LTAATPEERCLYVNAHTGGYEFFPSPKRELHADQRCAWRISPEPFWLDQQTYAFFEQLGDYLLAFYRAANRLYQHSRRGLQPSWVAEYLEAGKPERVIEYGVMKRFRADLPVIIRPDVILTSEGPVITELDSLPGGIGLCGYLNQVYAELGFEVVGGAQGMVNGFRDAVFGAAGRPGAVLGIVVSDESADYRPEMTWLGEKLRCQGLKVYNLAPEDVHYREDALYVEGPAGRERLDILYRFFELFDLKNIPKIDLILYAIRKEQVKVTPPLKSYLEEKMLLAFLHHPRLSSFWEQELGSEGLALLRRVVPMTWIIDDRPVPPYAVIPGLELDGRPVADWNELKRATKRQRWLVLKPSGFSELAWGARGVVIGHDHPQEVWARALDKALQNWRSGPYILQKFHKGARFKVRYYDFWQRRLCALTGRVRLTPYYFVCEGQTRLGGIMATVTPLNKKLIHGMTEAVMAPVAVRRGD